VRVAPIGVPPQERTMFYCPTCQGGLGPTDDGRRQNPLGSNGGARRSRRSY
jgi:endonuclease-8